MAEPASSEPVVPDESLDPQGDGTSDISPDVTVPRAKSSEIQPAPISLVNSSVNNESAPVGIDSRESGGKGESRGPMRWLKSLNMHREDKGSSSQRQRQSPLQENRQDPFYRPFAPDAGSGDESLSESWSRSKDKNGRNGLKIASQIKNLQQQLLDLEQQTRPALADEMHEAAWNKNLHHVGPREEARRWENEKKLRKTAILMSSASYDEGSDWLRKMDSEIGRKLGEQLVYEEKLLKLRKEWERKHGFQRHVKRHFERRRGGLSGSTSDSMSDDNFGLSDYDEDPRETFHRRRQFLRDSYEFETRKLEMEYEFREMRVQRRNRNRGGMFGRPKKSPSSSILVKETWTTDPAPAEASSPEPLIIPSAKAMINPVEWAQFKSTRFESEADSYAIDILIGEPIINLDHRGYWPSRLTEFPRKAETTQEKKGTARPVIKAGTALPERLRIHSRQLIKVLSMIHGEAFDGDNVVLLRPFRVLLHYNTEIRDWEAKLQNKFTKNNTAAVEASLVDQNDVEEAPTMSGSKDSGADAMDGTSLQVQTDEQRQDEVVKDDHDDNKDKQAEDDSNSLVALEHMKILLSFMNTDLRTKITSLRGDSVSCDKVVFSDLWHLYHPGDYVIGNDGKQAYRILRIESCPHRVDTLEDSWFYRSRRNKEEEEEKPKPLNITCVYLDFDGDQLGPVSRVFPIEKFEGERAITSLDIYPLQFYKLRQSQQINPSKPFNPNQDPRKYLIDRGRKFLRVCAVNPGAFEPMYYTGPALEPRDTVESQVVVDFEAALAVDKQQIWKPKLELLIMPISDEEKDNAKAEKAKCRQECCEGENVHDDSYVERRMNDQFMRQLLPTSREELPSIVVLPRALDTKDPEVGLSEDDLTIMSYRVFGFVLRNRTWAQLDLTYLTDNDPRDEGLEGEHEMKDEHGNKLTVFDKLVLPDEHRHLILSLVAQHFRDKEAGDMDKDMVRGKGKGLIMLLHGAPGVGKTTTAEGIAEKFNKPLFQLTCGDLGTTAKDVEDSLARNFTLANRWGCVLLLDEADVFLAQRTKDDFQRNGLIAVFLRVLEYYAGILFLTTNRVGDFDEAFASRIHISLYYPELDDGKALDVFLVNLNMIEKRFARRHREFKANRAKIGAFCQRYWQEHPFDHWNGRQIRNACLTAVALAEYEAQGTDPYKIINPEAVVELKVSHFEEVAKAYLEFSEYIKDIYGTHAARRAKEAGLRAMWVDNKGRLVGSIGPKESGILKTSRRDKFRRMAQGQGGSPYPEQQQQMQMSHRSGQRPGVHGYEREEVSHPYPSSRGHDEYGSYPQHAEYKDDYQGDVGEGRQARRDAHLRVPLGRQPPPPPHQSQDDSEYNLPRDDYR